MQKFWRWETTTLTNASPPDPDKEQEEESPETEPDKEEEKEDRILYLDGAISTDSWYDDDVTPKLFRDELEAGEGDITVWINSPGGDCVAAAQIYNMLKEYNGDVSVKIDGLAASAASVIAMAGDEVLMSPVSTMMIHNPSTIAAGDSAEMKKVTQMLDEVKESIINAYEGKTHLSRRELGKLMDSEYWMNANEALDKGFIDGILYSDSASGKTDNTAAAYGYSPVQITNSIQEKIAAKCKIEKPEPEKPEGRHVDELMSRLDLVKKYF